MCRWLIQRGQARVAPAMAAEYSAGRWMRYLIRTGLAAGFGLAGTDIVVVLTQKRLELASGLHIHQKEAPHMLSDEAGQEYKAHFDFLMPNDPSFAHALEAMGQRGATCLIWLNEDYVAVKPRSPRSTGSIADGSAMRCCS
jgi:prolyl 4-hydroxylase